MDISYKVKRYGIFIFVFLLVLVQLLMRAANDIENSIGDGAENRETLGEKLYSVAIKQGIKLSSSYMLYLSGDEKSGMPYRISKNLPLEQCLLLEAEDDGHMTEYRQPSALEEMAVAENNMAYQNSLVNEVEIENHEANVTQSGQQQELEDAVLAENTASTGTFVPVLAPVAKYSEQQLIEPDFIKKTFYSEDPTTKIRADQLQYNTLMGFDAGIKQDNSNVQILVYHTHSQETYIDSTGGDSNTSIVGVGEHLCEILRTQYGFNVLHHIGEYDVESRDYAYSNAMSGLEKVLAENPTIEVMIDLHRD